MTVGFDGELPYKSVRVTNGHGPLRVVATDVLAENGESIGAASDAIRDSPVVT
jgi:hypothetical protein